MKIKKPMFIIIPLLLLLLLLFFICSDRGGLFKDKTSDSGISGTDSIGQMREVTPGEESDDSADIKGRDEDAGGQRSDFQQYGTREVSQRKTSGTSTGAGSSERVKAVSEKRIAESGRERASGRSGTSARETTTPGNGRAGEAERSVKDEKIKAIDNSSSDDGIKTAALKEEKPAVEKEAYSGSITDRAAERGEGSGRIDRIHLYSGEIITGIVAGRGRTYTILTPEGIRKVAAADIQGNDIIK